MVIPNTVPVYRILHINNLETCLIRGGMHAPNSVPNDRLVYQTIHNADIQNVRKTRYIPCGKDGTIHDYVPFYFCNRSPMLLNLFSGRVPGYEDGQDPIIYAVTDIGTVQHAGLDFVFSDGHGIAAYTSWYDDLSKLDKIDWNVIGARYWACTEADPDRQCRKQAEFLIHKFCPWSIVTEVGVFNNEVKAQVQAILNRYGKTTLVNVRRQWYY